MKPKVLGGDAPDVDGKDPRQALAQWLTSAGNDAFAQTMSNVIWAHFFGRGIVEPVDDVRISNPPSNKELLEELGRKLVGYGFDKKKLIRDICNSRTYQLSAASNATNELDESYFSHSYVRRLREKYCSTQFRESPRPRIDSRNHRRERERFSCIPVAYRITF